MKLYLIIPAYNEEQFLGNTLESLVNQTKVPDKIIIVDDHSTDKTSQIAKEYTQKYSFVEYYRHQSEAIHLPGSKVIKAFNYGLSKLDQSYDLIGKIDADLIFPSNYFEILEKTFLSDKTIGLAGGFAFVEKNGHWEKEQLTDNDHVRGAFKVYTKKCFQQIGGLQPAMGWDTVDELLAKYYQWQVKTIANLNVKHLKPTGKNYDKKARYKQGEAFYTLGYGFVLTFIAAVKLAIRKKQPLLFIDYILGYLKAKKNRVKKLVNTEQENFVRQYRWKKIREKIFLSNHS